MTEQEKAFKKFSRLKCGALFMSMGMGKTKVALELAQYKYGQNKIDRILYIAPASSLNSGTIEAERLKWTPNLPIVYSSCEGFGSSDKKYLTILEMVQNYRTFCICDESLYIKNIKAKRTSRIIEVGKYCNYRLILNGSPATKNIMDLWTQMEFLSPKILNMSIREYKNTFCEYFVKSKRRSNKGRIVKQRNVPYLISKISPYIYQADLDIEFQKKYNSYLYSVNISDYNNYKNELFEKYFDGEDLNFYAFSQKLQKYYTNQEEHKIAVENLIKEINEKVIVFVKYLENIPDGANCIVGETKNRTEIINDFKNNKFKVLYLTYGVGAFSLNLQFCKNIIFADHDWDYAKRIQAEGRIYRMDIQDDVNYYDLVCSNSGLEMKILKCINKKGDFLNEMKSEIERIKGDKEKAKLFIKEL